MNLSETFVREDLRELSAWGASIRKDVAKMNYRKRRSWSEHKVRALEQAGCFADQALDAVEREQMFEALFYTINAFNTYGSVCGENKGTESKMRINHRLRLQAVTSALGEFERDYCKGCRTYSRYGYVNNKCKEVGAPEFPSEEALKTFISENGLS